mgnify:CR=1 FL=1
MWCPMRQPPACPPLSRSLGRFFSSCHVRVKSCLDVGDDCSLILVNSYLVATHTSHLDTPPCDRQRHLSRHRRRASVSASVCVRARSSSFVVGSFVVGSFVRSFVGVFWDFWISLRVIFEEFADVPSFVPSFAHSFPFPAHCAFNHVFLFVEHVQPYFHKVNGYYPQMIFQCQARQGNLR